MANKGAPFVGPTACPFVAFEQDRDQRSDQPDYRHRCYAEQVPAPRTITHQQKFCLSPDFAACPVFAEWALRAAARPIAPTPTDQSEAAPLVGVVATTAAPDPGANAQDVWFERLERGHQVEGAPGGEGEKWPDSMDTSLPVAGAAAAAAAASSEAADGQQLAVFGASPSEPVGQALPSAPQGTAEGEPEPTGDEVDEVPLPTFLSARSSRPRAAQAPERVTPENVVPSWDIDDRYGAQPAREPDGEGPFSRILTLVAVLIILALGVATVLIVPGLLAGGSGQTLRPSFVAAQSGFATPLATSVAVLPGGTSAASVTPVESIPTPEATPTPTPRTYTIQPGDTLKRIAREFGVTMDQILAANPQISDANDIQVDQRIVIPSP